MEAHTGNIQKNLDKENVRDNQVDGNIQNMKLENFQSNFLIFLQKIYKVVSKS